MVIQTGSESMNISIFRFRSREEEEGQYLNFHHDNAWLAFTWITLENKV